MARPGFVNILSRTVGKVAKLVLGGGVFYFTAAGVPVDGTTGAGFAAKGSEYINLTTGEHYINTGTKASPVWKAVTHAA